MKNTDRLGTAHAAQAAKVSDAFNSVLSVSTPEFAALLKTEQRRLTDWRARIAVVGQVKAGKSTFLSALIRQPQFLPSEINPWTSVITNLRFGHPDDPEAGGVFHFFGEKDWDRIIEGDRETRKLAEELLPGFTSEVLERQVREMRERARTRLGRFYNVLLGREHRYDYITRDILERYVCAGTDDEEPVRSENVAGRYSDITERADIFFPPGLFAIPTVFTDTPGVNDPFLVRDEFTCRTLLHSDIFVVTLSAHQALTEVDIGLVKMLAAHKGKRIIIFINRIDELDAFETTAPEIQASVSARVAEAVPDRNFDVIVGSAHWAEIAVGADEGEKADAANKAGLRRFIADHYGSDAEDPARVLEVASGLVAVEQAIDSAVSNGVGQALLAETTSALGTISTAVLSLHKTRAEELRQSQGGGSKDSLADAIRASLSTRSEAARDIAIELQEHFDAAETAQSDLIARSWDAFQRELKLVGHNFIDQETETLLALVSGGSADSQLDIDMIELRSLLEVQIAESYASARDRMDFALSRTSALAARLIRPLLGETKLNFDTRNLPHMEVAPIWLTTTQSLTLELTTERGWKFWQDNTMSRDQATAALKQVILAEIEPSIENLAVIAHEALVERSAEAMRRMTSLSTVTVESISEGAAQYDREQAENGDATVSEPGGVQQQDKLASEIADLDGKIDLIDTALAGIGAGPGGAAS